MARIVHWSVLQFINQLAVFAPGLSRDSINSRTWGGLYSFIREDSAGSFTRDVIKRNGEIGFFIVYFLFLFVYV